ncbi:hypothetical protein HF283_20695 [Acidithiobacillus ferrooxidans]|uniref:hypothetical protein n=1 Tax=Acidithiobacillus ferridurans TaxID=1232575 RepID=UPI001C065CC0|nr:hypothetical protein [Acidithiobacillus ferridurans]MBU2805224.1 hypothetical protein [Acidithiobacillus ferridurans]MBU2826485.1 hypothetical protein [Acidithiobacillus ferrooxidans]
MGAVLAAFAEWLGPFVLSIVGWLVASIGPAVLASLTIGVGVFTGLSVIQSDLSSVIFNYSALPTDMLDLARLLGVTFVIKLFVSAFSVRVSLMAAKVFFIHS